MPIRIAPIVARHRRRPARSASPAGCSTALVVTLGRVPSIVVTLGTLSVFRGLNSLWAGGKQISADQVPQAWLDMTSADDRSACRPSSLIALVDARRHRLRRCSACPPGAQLYAIGSNPDGAALIGIRSTGLVLGAFAHVGPARRLRRRALGLALRHHRCPRRDSASS